jgi:hypothetical protein
MSRDNGHSTFRLEGPKIVIDDYVLAESGQAAFLGAHIQHDDEHLFIIGRMAYTRQWIARKVVSDD